MYTFFRKHLGAIVSTGLATLLTLLGFASCKGKIIGRDECLYGGPPEAYRNLPPAQNDTTQADATLPTKAEQQQE